MATNTGNNHRVGAVKGRSQFLNPNGGNNVRDTSNGQIIRQQPNPAKGVRKESSKSSK